MTPDKTAAQAVAAAINTALALSPAIVFKRVPHLKTEGLAARVLWLSPYSDESELVTRDYWQDEIQLALTHSAPLNAADEAGREAQIEAELEAQELIRNWLRDPDHELPGYHLVGMRRLAILDLETAAKRSVFYSQLLLELKLTG